MARPLVRRPSLPGDALLLELKGDVSYVAHKGAFVCCDEGVNVGVHCTSCSQGCCGGEGFFMQKFSGNGRLVLGAFGSIIRYDLKPGEVRIIDNGVLVAFPTNIQWEIGTVRDSGPSPLVRSRLLRLGPRRSRMPRRAMNQH